MKKFAFIIAAVVLLALFAVGIRFYQQNFTVTIPHYAAMEEKPVWLNQQWTPQQRDWFHHADQGTQTFGIPYEWFIALEQPALSLSSPGLFSDTAYLDRYGFIPAWADPGNSDLPIGFAHGGRVEEVSGETLLNPQTKQPMTSLGLTCAACHTGRFTYQGKTVLVDGGPALTNIQKFQQAIGLSIIYTRLVPGRFIRFADRVLGPGASDEAKAKLHAQFMDVYKQVTDVHNLENSVKDHTIEEGFTRLDALTRIGNTVFALDIDHHENFLGYSAPVHYPRIWNVSWFEWVQYNGSIQQPMTRNAGEALGVRATVNFPVAKDQLPTSSVQVDTIYGLEQQLAGPEPPTVHNHFTGLASPKWPDKILPPIDTQLTAKGAALYKSHCLGCHLPATSDPDFWTAPQWLLANEAGERYLNLNMIDISHVDTDSAQASDMAQRNVSIPATLGIKDKDGNVVTTDTFGDALRQIVTTVVNRWYDIHNTPPAQRDKMNGFRPDGVRALLAYKARPLNGIWATPPYLHNASVPNIYALLSPVSERPQIFYLGSREYDPVHVGYQTGADFSGAFKFDTSFRGNSNSGHEFNNGSGQGIIGPLLAPEDRLAIIEFLKSM
jgi:processive rubber oxygenase RoxA-like protein